jgi:hypothetical protein
MKQLVQKLELLIELPCFAGSNDPFIIPADGELMLIYKELIYKEFLCINV